MGLPMASHCICLFRCWYYCRLGCCERSLIEQESIFSLMHVPIDSSKIRLRNKRVTRPSSYLRDDEAVRLMGIVASKAAGSAKWTIDQV